MTKSYQEKIADNLLYVRYSVSMWTAKVIDKKVARESAENAGAERYTRAATRYLMKPEIKDIHSLGNAGRLLTKQDAYSMGLATGIKKDQGAIQTAIVWRNKLPIMQGIVQQWTKLVQEFCDPNVYFPLIQEDMKRQGKDANVNDYPATIELLQSKFEIDLKVGKFNIGQTMLFDIFDESINDIEEASEKKAKEFVEAIAIENLKRLKEPVKVLLQKLDEHGKNGKYFKQPTIDAIEQIVASMSGMNFSGDKRVDDVVRSIKNSLSGLDSDSLRENVEDRERVMKRAESIAHNIDSYF